MGNGRELSRVVARQAALENAIAALRRRYGDRIIRMAADAPALVGASDPDALSTGSLSLDLLTGGLPRGQISEIAGPDGTGKGTLAYVALAACQRAGGLALLVDADNAADPDALRAAGVDLTRLLLAYPAGAAAAWDVLGALARCGALNLGPELESVSPAAMGGVDRFSRVLGRVFHRIVASLAIRLSVQIAWYRAEHG